MISIDKRKDARAPWTRRVFGTFVIVCLNLALQPCAMAMGGEQDHDCPHCPPAETQGHHGHHGSKDKEVDSSPCGLSADDCSLGDDLNYDGRNASSKLKDSPNDVPLAISDFIEAETDTRYVDLGGVCPTRSPPPTSSTPLNVLYCVYLD